MHLSAGTRASDAEREEAAATLTRHYAEGRLSLRELELRSTEVYSARRRGELARLLADLPVVREGFLSWNTFARRLSEVHHFLLRGHAVTYASVNGFLTAVWVLTGEGAFWPALYLVPSTALLAWHWAGGRMVARGLSRATGTPLSASPTLPARRRG